MIRTLKRYIISNFFKRYFGKENGGSLYYLFGQRGENENTEIHKSPKARSYSYLWNCRPTNVCARRENPKKQRALGSLKRETLHLWPSQSLNSVIQRVGEGRLWRESTLRLEQGLSQLRTPRLALGESPATPSLSPVTPPSSILVCLSFSLLSSASLIVRLKYLDLPFLNFSLFWDQIRRI